MQLGDAGTDRAVAVLLRRSDPGRDRGDPRSDREPGVPDPHQGRPPAPGPAGDRRRGLGSRGRHRPRGPGARWPPGSPHQRRRCRPTPGSGRRVDRPAGRRRGAARGHVRASGGVEYHELSPSHPAGIHTRHAEHPAASTVAPTGAQRRGRTTDGRTSRGCRHDTGSCWRPACISATRHAAGTRRCVDSSWASATGSTSSICARP